MTRLAKSFGKNHKNFKIGSMKNIGLRKFSGKNPKFKLRLKMKEKSYIQENENFCLSDRNLKNDSKLKNEGNEIQESGFDISGELKAEFEKSPSRIPIRQQNPTLSRISNNNKLAKSLRNLADSMNKRRRTNQVQTRVLPSEKSNAPASRSPSRNRQPLTVGNHRGKRQSSQKISKKNQTKNFKSRDHLSLPRKTRSKKQPVSRFSKFDKGANLMSVGSVKTHSSQRKPTISFNLSKFKDYSTSSTRDAQKFRSSPHTTKNVDSAQIFYSIVSQSSVSSISSDEDSNKAVKRDSPNLRRIEKSPKFKGENLFGAKPVIKKSQFHPRLRENWILDRSPLLANEMKFKSVRCVEENLSIPFSQFNDLEFVKSQKSVKTKIKGKKIFERKTKKSLTSLSLAEKNKTKKFKAQYGGVKRVINDFRSSRIISIKRKRKSKRKLAIRPLRFEQLDLQVREKLGGNEEL
jgi:hypothetical protein